MRLKKYKRGRKFSYAYHPKEKSIVRVMEDFFARKGVSIKKRNSSEGPSCDLDTSYRIESYNRG